MKREGMKIPAIAPKLMPAKPLTPPNFSMKRSRDVKTPVQQNRNVTRKITGDVFIIFSIPYTGLSSETGSGCAGSRTRHHEDVQRF